MSDAPGPQPPPPASPPKGRGFDEVTKELWQKDGGGVEERRDDALAWYARKILGVSLLLLACSYGGAAAPLVWKIETAWLGIIAGTGAVTAFLAGLHFLFIPHVRI